MQQAKENGTMAAGSASFCWRVHPARERPVAALATGLVIAGVALAVWVETASTWCAAGSALLLVLSLQRFYFPSRFQIDDEGLVARHLLGTRSCRWAQVRRFVYDRRGGLLSTRSRPSWLDPWRGVALVFDRSADEAIEQIRRHLKTAGEQR